MKKNTSGQKIGAQMVSATDGSAFTGSVTVYVTGDAGTQAIGSVGSGACTHEGNGYHTYAPSVAETNYDLVAFTFIGTGAVPTTVQVFTFDNLVNHVYAIDLSAITGEASRSPLNALRFLRNKWVISSGSLIVYEEDDTTTAWTGLVSTQAAAQNVTGVDP